MFNPRGFENSRPDGFPVLEIIDETAHPSPQARRFVPLQDTQLIGEVSGPVAGLQLRQRFRFGADQSSRPIEARYRFPLPGDAAVTGVQVRFGEVAISATLAERESAELDYQAARQAGRQASLLTREAPNVFSLQVTGLKPDEDVSITTCYVQLAQPEGDGWTLRVPLTTIPRYVRGDERGSRFAEGQPLAVLRDPGHVFSLDLTLEAAEQVTSPTHPLTIDAGEGRARITLRDGQVIPDRDFVLTWQPQRQAGRPTLQVFRHREQTENATCFLALVTPPAAGTAPTPLPRELILLIDHSGSMSGPKWQAADWAVQNLLAGVSSADTFNLGLFHHETRWFSRSPVRGDERTVRQARDFLLAHHDSGGTELGVALEQALGQQRDTDKRSRHVVIVTDAQVSDAGRILALAEREAGQSERRRVDVLCIDAAPNAGLAAELAERGGGLARFLTSDPTENDIASALDEILADWSAPVLRNLALEIDSPSVQAAGRQVRTRGQERSTIDLGDLPAGRAIWVAGRIEEALASGAPVSLVADGVTIAEASAHDDAGTEDRPAVAALFGARRVLDIELAQTSGISLETRLRQLGYDPGKELSDPSAAGASPIYAENARQQSSDALKGLLVREALRYGIVCSVTAFVATRQEAGEQIAGTVDVANALAHGWSDDFLMARHAVGGAPTMFRAAAPMPASFAPPAAESTGDLRMSRNLHQLEPWDDTSAPPPAPGAGSGFGLGGLAEAPLEAARNLARRLRKSGHANEAARPTSPSGVTVFSGTPAFTDGEAVLFDSQFDPERLSGLNRLSRLLVHTNQGGDTDSGLVIALYVDDLAAPRARVRLEDVLRQGGERPLNIRLQAGQRVRLLLLDAAGAWAASAPSLEVRLG